MSDVRNIRQMKRTYKFKKDVIREGTPVTVQHLLRSLPFTTKSRLCTIRKNALYETLMNQSAHVRKSYSLPKLLDIAKETFSYDKEFTILNNRMKSFHYIVRKYLRNVELRLLGPGIPVSRCVNEDCPYTIETLTDIPRNNIFTWKNDKVYGCQFMALWNLLGSKLERRGKLFESNLELYDEMINMYETTLSRGRLTNRTRHNRNPLFDIQNPFTRQPIPAEAFRRMLLIGKRQGLITKEPENQRIQSRRIPHRLRSINDNTSRENIRTMANEECITVSTQVSELMRSLDFYTPDTILLDIIRPVYTYCNRTDDRPLSLDHASGIHVFDYVRQSCIPILEHLRERFHNPIIRRNPIFRSTSHRMFISDFRRGSQIRLIHQRASDVITLDPDYDRPPRIIPRIRSFLRLFLSLWTRTFNVFLDILTSDTTDIEDKKNVVIYIIISLAQTGHLREGFEWAIGI
jgi:hypothetical protein